MSARVERPDLEAYKAIAEPAARVRSDDAGRLATRLVDVIDYALQLEQDAAGLKRALAEMRQEARNLWVIVHGDNCCWEDECKRPGRECQWPLPAILGAAS